MFAGIHCEDVEEEESGIRFYAAYQKVGQILLKDIVIITVYDGLDGQIYM